MPGQQTMVGKRGPGLFASLLLLVFGGGLAMVILSLFLTGLAQKEILPILRARAEKAVAAARAHMPARAPEVAAVPARDSLRVDPADSLGALETQLETERRILDSRREELERMRGGIDSVLARHRQAQDAELSRQAKLLGGMRPLEAARILDAMDDASLRALLGAMNARAAAKVVPMLDARRMAQLSMAAIGSGEAEAVVARAESPAVPEQGMGQ